MKLPSVTMDKLRDIALGMLIVLNVVAMVVSFGESFAGLFQWASHHSITGFQAGVWPLMVDVIILVGEAGLFIAHHGHWRKRDKAWLWFVTITALGVSAGGNVGHIESVDWLSRLTAALPPMALFFSMTVGFGVMKRVYLNRPVASQPVISETISGPLTAMVRTGLPGASERSHTGTVPWAETSALESFERPPESPEQPVAADPDATSMDIPRITAKGALLTPDPRRGLNMTEIRVRDAYDANPDITVNAIAKANNIAWATARRHLDATIAARSGDGGS